MTPNVCERNSIHSLHPLHGLSHEGRISKVDVLCYCAILLNALRTNNNKIRSCTWTQQNGKIRIRTRPTKLLTLWKWPEFCDAKGRALRIAMIFLYFRTAFPGRIYSATRAKLFLFIKTDTNEDLWRTFSFIDAKLTGANNDDKRATRFGVAPKKRSLCRRALSPWQIGTKTSHHPGY